MSPSDPTPLLMIPVRRCGSHALRLRLSKNPAFYSPYPMHVIDFMPLVPLYGDLADDAAYFQLVVDVVGLQSGLMVKWKDTALDPVAIFEAIRHEPRNVHRVVWELLLTAGRQHGARVVMDKSLESVFFASELLDLFPKMRFLNVARDPRAQVASMTQAIILEFDVVLNAMLWARAHAEAGRLAVERPEQVLTVRYEDLISHPELTLQRICDFVGMDFVPEMVDVSTSGEARHMSRLSALWSSNDLPPIVANIDKFKRSLTVEQITWIESITAEHMDRYGYVKLTEADRVLDEGVIAEAQARAAEQKLRSWQKLRVEAPQDYILRRFRADYLDMLKRRLTAT
jgi:hypothetical protein